MLIQINKFININNNNYLVIKYEMLYLDDSVEICNPTNSFVRTAYLIFQNKLEISKLQLSAKRINELWKFFKYCDNFSRTICKGNDLTFAPRRDRRRCTKIDNTTSSKSICYTDSSPLLFCNFIVLANQRSADLNQLNVSVMNVRV